jgi:glycosyltransferase involved in cell wall biosynthesis
MQSNEFGSVRVVGLARNVESTLHREITRLRKVLQGVFKEVTFFVVESDSSDNTVKVLEELSRKFPEFSYSSLGELESREPHRIKRLVRCRNTYVEWLRNTSHSDYVVVIDFDIRNTKLRSKYVKKSIDSLPSAAGVFTNQAGRYFDIYALRSAGWSEGDCQSEYWELRKVLPPEAAKYRAIWSKMRKISRRRAPIEVDSAFGGFGIYKSWVDQFDYSPIQDSPIQESEHINLHRKIRELGGKLYIHPALMNFGWNPHNLLSFKFFRYLDSASKLSPLGGIRRLVRDNIR